jgi:hypothetical protein
MSSFRNLFLLIIAGTTSLNIPSQEHGTQNSKPISKEELRFKHLFSEKSVDTKAFNVDSRSRLSSIDLRSLNLSQESADKQPLVDEPVELPKSGGRRMPKQLGEVDLLRTKRDNWAKGIEQKHVIGLGSLGATSLSKRDISDMK